MGTSARIVARPAWLLAAVLLTPLATRAQSGITATLVANDPIYAQWVYWPGGAPGASQSHPAGPLTGAAVQIGYGISSNVASYSCTLQSTGDSHTFQAACQCSGYINGAQASLHADLTLMLTGPTDRVVGISARLDHGGDQSDGGGMRVDLGNDGSIELDSGCGSNCGSPLHHRLWTWDFANGPLPIRIRSDQITSFGAQGYSLSLAIRPWVEAATPTGTGCGGTADLFNTFDRETTNYQIAAEGSPLTQELAILRAVGLGQFSAFVIADLPTVTALRLPSPFTSSCDVLSSALWLDFGVVSATTTIGGFPATPREWQLHVPLLPPGITFHVQHASAQPTAPFWFGTSNRIRIDT